MSDLKPMDVAPTDGYILAKTLPRPDDERFSHYGDRWFAVRHAGRTSQMDLDMGWHLFPGMGVSADWFAGWMHIPEKDRIATLEAQLAEAGENIRQNLVELERINHTKATDFNMVRQLIVDNRATLSKIGGGDGNG